MALSPDIKITNPDCWVCGEPGIPAVMSAYYLQCHRHPEGIVEWLVYDKDRRPLTNSVNGIFTIDFTESDAPSSPG